MGIAILVPDELDLKWKKVTRDKDRKYIMIKGTIHQDDYSNYIYASHIGTPKHIKKVINRPEG